MIFLYVVIITNHGIDYKKKCLIFLKNEIHSISLWFNL